MIKVSLNTGEIQPANFIRNAPSTFRWIIIPTKLFPIQKPTNPTNNVQSEQNNRKAPYEVYQLKIIELLLYRIWTL